MFGQKRLDNCLQPETVCLDVNGSIAALCGRQRVEQATDLKQEAYRNKLKDDYFLHYHGSSGQNGFIETYDGNKKQSEASFIGYVYE